MRPTTRQLEQSQYDPMAAGPQGEPERLGTVHPAVSQMAA
jgi:hypothetical protein